MRPIRYTLLSDGSTDKVLLHHLRWLMVANGGDRPLEPMWADLRSLPRPPSGFSEKIIAALDLCPCEIFFVHRDAEREQQEVRTEEIRRGISQVCDDLFLKQPYVAVVPVRMTEAWLLFDEAAIRRAAGNPSGRDPIAMPPLARMDSIPDPKSLLHDLLLSASGLSSRRLGAFKVAQAVHRVAELIDDFAPLRVLPTFAALEADVRIAIAAL